MKKMSRVLIDVDDVTAQFRRRFMELLNELFGMNLTLEGITHQYKVEVAAGLTKRENNIAWKEVNKKGFAQTLQLMEGAAEYIDRIASRHEVYFVTAHLKSSDTWVSDRTRWIRKHFGNTLANQTIYTKMKHTIDGDVLIEDNLRLLQAWLWDRTKRCGTHRGHHPMVYEWPYNSLISSNVSLPRFDGWKKIAGALGC